MVVGFFRIGVEITLLGIPDYAQGKSNDREPACRRSVQKKSGGQVLLFASQYKQTYKRRRVNQIYSALFSPNNRFIVAI